MLGNLPFVGVGRVADAVILATWHAVPGEGKADREMFQKLVVASQKKLRPGQRTRLMQQQGGAVSCMLDARGELVVCVTTSTMDYPEKMAFGLLQELLAHIYELLGGCGEAGAPSEAIAAVPAEGLQSQLVPRIQELVGQYEDPAKADQYMQTMGQMDKVTSMMKQNLAKVADTSQNLDALNDKVGLMKDAAAGFAEDSSDLAARMRSTHWLMSPKGIAIMAIGLLLLFCIIKSLFFRRS